MYESSSLGIPKCPPCLVVAGEPARSPCYFSRLVWLRALQQRRCCPVTRVCCGLVAATRSAPTSARGPACTSKPRQQQTADGVLGVPGAQSPTLLHALFPLPGAPFPPLCPACPPTHPAGPGQAPALPPPAGSRAPPSWYPPHCTPSSFIEA